MTPQKTIILESTVFIFSIAFIGLLIISNQTFLLDLLDSVQNQIQEVSRAATDPNSYQ